MKKPSAYILHPETSKPKTLMPSTLPPKSKKRHPNQDADGEITRKELSSVVFLASSDGHGRFSEI